MQTAHRAIDTSKTVFHLHSTTDAAGHCTGRLEVKCSRFLAYFAEQSPRAITLEAYGGWSSDRLGSALRNGGYHAERS